MIKRVVYGLIGVAGVGSLWWMLSSWSEFWSMGWFTSIAIMLLIIGGLNWGIVAVTGKKDLFDLLKIK
jgi:uncharacterized membrane protein YuzA (DUF378 family)